MKLGAAYYLKKPFDHNEVILAAKTIIEKKRKNEPISNTFFDLRNSYHNSIEVPEDNKDIPLDIFHNITLFKDYIDENYTQWTSIQDACKMTLLNKTYFCHYFKRITGIRTIPRRPIILMKN